MGEWQAWHPTVSRQSRSTDITDGFGPGTRWSTGPESYIDEVVAASPGLLLAASPVFRVPSGPPARSPPAPRAYGSARRLEARPGPAGPPAPSTLVARVCHDWPGPAAALRHPGMHLGPPAPSTLVARVCRGRPGPAAALRHRGCGCVAGVLGAVGPARPLAVRAASLWLGASARSPARPCGPAGTLHTGGVGVSWAARPERGGSTASAQNYRAHDGVCEKCDGLNVSEPTEHSTIAGGVHAVE